MAPFQGALENVHFPRSATWGYSNVIPSGSGDMALVDKVEIDLRMPIGSSADPGGITFV